MLVTLLLFQGGILYSMGLTMLTSDILVTAITIVLAVCAILSLTAMIRSMVANKKNKKLIHNIIADVEGSKEAEKTVSPAPAPVQAQEEVKKESTPVVSDTSSDDDEPEEANGESIPEVVTTATHVTPDTEDSDKKIVGSVVSKGMDESTLETLDKLMGQNNEKDMTPPVVVAPDVQSAMQEKTEPVEKKQDEHVEQACAPVEEEPVKEEPVKEPVEEPVPAKEAVEETPAHEEEQPAVELTKFENSMVMLMKRGNVPENVYAIEEYKEGAVCLTHDKEHYFVYICKDNDADDVEYFPIHDEKAVAMAYYPYNSIVAPLLRKEAICSGYAKTFAYLMNKAGYEAAYCTGYTNGGIYHAWNAIVYNGEITYIDSTYNASGNHMAYFCRNKEDLKERTENSIIWFSASDD